MKFINKKVNELWQSQNKEMGEKGLLWMALVFSILVSVFVIPNKFLNGIFDKHVFKYLIVAFACLALLSFASYFYIYSKVRLPNWVISIVIFLYKTLLILCFLVCIPIMIFIKITEIILDYRAKKLDNLENWMIIIVIDLFVIMSLCYVDILCIEVVTELISVLIMNKYEVRVSKDPIALFLLLGLIKLEMDMVNMAILKIMNHYGMSKIRGKVNKKKRDKREKISPNEDIAEYLNKAKEEIEKFEEEQIYDLRYDLEYQKKTIWKFQLACLIILFLIASFVPDFLFKKQSDAINVITAFTLFMLYFDKRKEWK